MPYNVFISWSKERSRLVGAAMADFLPQVIQAAKPWFSPDDIPKGKTWRAEIHGALDTIKLAIIVITPENKSERWIHYESGILAASLKDPTTLICPYLVDVEVKDIESPLADLNVTSANSDDTRKMIRSLASQLNGELPAATVDKAFNVFWPEFDAKLQEVIERKPERKNGVPKRSTDEVLNDLTALVRDVHKIVTAQSVPAAGIPRPAAIGQAIEFLARLSADGLGHADSTWPYGGPAARERQLADLFEWLKQERLRSSEKANDGEGEKSDIPKSNNSKLIKLLA